RATIPAVSEGDLDEFRLVRPLGRGGMGEVYLGHDTVLDRAVAIKLIRRADDIGSRERFLTEARAIARLSHPNVVTIYRVGTTPTGQPYLVQELIRGKSLDQMPRPLPWREVCALAIGIARGLDAAHRRGILHRDIKLANVMVDEHGTARVLDFGLAKLTADTPRVVDPPAPPARFALGSDPREAETVDPTAVTGVAETADLPVPQPQPQPPTADPTSATPEGFVVGTPRYTAPENWCGEPSTERSDLYSLGVVIYELVSGMPPYPQTTPVELEAAVLAGGARPLSELAAATSLPLARLAMRCLARDPAARPGSAAEVAHELEALLVDAPAVPGGNPYRGLRAFAAEHRGLFFGRGSDIAAVVDRLRAEPLVVVVGDSGIGKSSVCHAGVAPAVLAGALGDRRRWRIVTVVPGRAPWAAIGEALATTTSTPSALVRAIRPAEDAGILLVIDQLEELVTLADPDEAAQVAELLTLIANGVPGLKALAAVRGDFLTRVAAVPMLGGPMTRGLHLLRTLAAADLREAVVGPARANNVRFETEAMVSALVDTVAGSPGALPLLQFTLAELWQARDVEHAVIPARALAELGGVEGGLAGHADAVLLAMSADERAAACRIALRLVTDVQTRATHDREALVGDDPVATAALESLVRGRLVVARDAVAGNPIYELAHEALIRSWGTLRDLLDSAAGRHAARNRLVAAATEWERLARRDDLLWTPHQLDEIRDVVDLSPRERAFVEAARRRSRRRWIVRIATIAALPLIVLVGFAVVRFDAARTRASEVTTRVETAAALRGEADQLAAQADLARHRAFESFDTMGDGEAHWSDARRLAQQAATTYRNAAVELEAAFALDADAVRGPMTAVLVAQAELAEAEHAARRVHELLDRLATYDPARAAALQQPASLTIDLDREATSIAIHAQAEGGPITGGFAQTPVATRAGLRLAVALPAGSYVAVITMSDDHVVRDPVLLRSGETLTRTLKIPPPRPGYVFVAAGRFLYGSANDDALRKQFLGAEPQRELETKAFWISRTEVTFEDWITYLHALPAAERARHRPTLATTQNTVELEERGDRFALEIKPTTQLLHAEPGEPLVYPDRHVRKQVDDWGQLPVVGVSYRDLVAYTTWLDRTKRVPGARPCTRIEWERAARGADGRTFPPGAELPAESANFDLTYGRETLAFGPDPVGSFPASDSPYGVADLAGNVWDLTVDRDGKPWIKGGCFYYGRLTAMAANTNAAELEQAGVRYGLRVCADPAR
ncbi:MAG: protein kinase, partial [Kofleriaceae bacterium]